MCKISHFIFKFLGWKGVLSVEIPPKCVVCIAPHTSNWDLIYCKLFASSIGLKVRFLIKKDWFFFPMNYIIKAMGGIPVDRKNKKLSLTEQMIDLIGKEKEIRLAIAPEGTRKNNAAWKTGFYYIASGAKIPIALVYVDYEKKEIGLTENFYPTGDEVADIKYIKSIYKDHKGKFPEKFSL